MRLLIYIVFTAIIASIGYHLYGAETDRREIMASFESATEELNQFEAEKIKLTEDIEYYSNPHNLEKELRAQFNYRAPNEKLIIVVPEDNQ